MKATQKQTLLFGTSNKGKLVEVGGLAARFGVVVEGLDSIGRQPPEVVEGFPTYEGNARHKAVEYARWSGRPCIADDTGIEIAALETLPGVYSARFGVARVAKLLGVGARSPAQFVCCISYAEPEGRVVSVTRALEGTFVVCGPEGLKALEGNPLPYAPLFTPQGATKTLSQLVGTAGFLSHRGLAFETLLKVLG